MKILQFLKSQAKKLKQEILVLYYAYKNPKLNLLPKLMILATLGYALSPIDLIPDFIPILGYVDDLIILPLLISLSIKLIPEHILLEARQMAENHRIKLKKRRGFAIIFVLIWILLLIWIVYKINFF